VPYPIVGPADGTDPEHEALLADSVPERLRQLDLTVLHDSH
jgi:hypothetical protein